METKSRLYFIALKMALSSFILLTLMVFSTPTLANKPSNTNPTYANPGTITLAHRGRWYGPGYGYRGGIWVNPGWGYPPPYWGPWTPYWTGGVYCRKRCLINRWGRVISCRVSCF
jgi:hypothetical protein